LQTVGYSNPNTFARVPAVQGSTNEHCRNMP
jgi:hypothetical protein